jgi:hypothetical protein
MGRKTSNLTSSPPAILGDSSVRVKLQAVICLLSGMAIAGSAAACGHRGVEKQQGVPRMSKQTIEQVQAKYQDEWMSIPGVVGIGIGAANGKPVIKVLVINKMMELEQQIPKEVEGYPVVIEETGEIRALSRKKKN